MTEQPEIRIERQGTLAVDGEGNVEIATSTEPVESDLKDWGAVEPDPRDRETRIDQPQGTLFGDDRPETGEETADAGEQSGLTREQDQDQRTLSGETGTETPAGWEK